MKRKLNFRILLGMAPLVFAGLACNFAGFGSPDQVPTSTVEEPATATVSASATSTATLEPTQTVLPPTITPSPTEEPCLDQAALVSHVTYEPGAFVPAGSQIDKTWRIRNDGNCSWDQSYALVYDSGAQLGAPDRLPLTGEVAPGQSVDLTVQLSLGEGIAEQEGFFLLENGSGERFGDGPGNDAFSFRIKPGFVVSLVFHSDLVFPAPSCFDLDEGEATGCNSGYSDLFHQQIPQTIVHQIIPVDGTTIGIQGGPEPEELSDCQVSLKDDPIQALPGQIICFETGAGVGGWLHIKAVVPNLITMDEAVEP